MKGHGEKKSRKEEIAILALLTEATMKEAAEKADISESTLWRWMQQEAFKDKYQQAKRQSIEHATARLRQGMTIAVNTLIEIMENKGSAMARVIAAKTVIESAMKAHEIEDLQDRVDRLEESLKENSA